jgi:hypothetical protein
MPVNSCSITKNGLYTVKITRPRKDAWMSPIVTRKIRQHSFVNYSEIVTGPDGASQTHISDIEMGRVLLQFIDGFLLRFVSDGLFPCYENLSEQMQSGTWKCHTLSLSNRCFSMLNRRRRCYKSSSSSISWSAS